MAGDRLEELVLSGELFDGPSRSSSPSRTPSPDSTPSRPWPTEDISDVNTEAAYTPNIIATTNTDVHDPNASIGTGPGRTGVKGVIRDHDEAAALSRAQRASEISALNRAMERASLGGKTFLEEEADKLKERIEKGETEKEALEDGSLFAMGMGSGMVGRMVDGMKRRRFGHLREVGEKGYVNAVEGEKGDVWVVVHIYDPVLERCERIDDVLVRLARMHSDTKFIRCRASAIGFASSSSSLTSSSGPGTAKRAIRSATLSAIDEDNPYESEKADYDGEEGEEDWDEEGDDGVDTDMLPTMLVYRAGQLVHNWVRVDWEAGDSGVKDLLERNHIIEPKRMSTATIGLPMDDEDDIGLSGS